MTPEAVAAAARVLQARRDAGAHLGPLPLPWRPATLADGYRIQAARHDRLDAAGRGHRVGYKIGCTTAVMRAFLDIPTPCAGTLRSDGLHREHAALPLASCRRAGIETEVAVTLALALPVAGAPYDRRRVAAAVATAHAAIEVVDDRYEDYRDLGAPSLVADDFFQHASILGPGVTAWRDLDLAGLAGTLRLDGAQVGRGVAGDIMGHPLEALVWLANALAARDVGLPAGAVVSLGSMVETLWVDAPCHAEVHVEGLGSATVAWT